MKNILIGLIVGAVVFIPTTSLAAYNDDWKLRINTGKGEASQQNVYIKEWHPNSDTVCYITATNKDSYGGNSPSISCVKR